MEHSLTIIDGIVLIIVLLSALVAMAQGLTREVLWIGSIFISIIIALYTSISLAPLLTSIVDITPISNVLSFEEEITGQVITGFIVFIFSWILLSVLSKQLVKWVEGSAISSVDRFMGLIFGVARGLFMIGFAYIVYTYFTPRHQYPDMLKTSYSLPVLDKTAKVIGQIAKVVIPDKYSSGLQSHIYTHQSGKLWALENKDTLSKASDKEKSSLHIDDITTKSLKNLDTKELDVILDTLKRADNIVRPAKDAKTRP